MNQDFRTRLRAGDPLHGPFFTTPSPRLAEVFGGLGFDCVCVDAEHGPLDRSDVDTLVMAFRLSLTPVVVRPPSGQTDHILAALDSGAAGVMIPHIITGEDAHAAVEAATYGPSSSGKGRGFAGGTRAADYGGLGMAELIARANASRVVIGQVEDAPALDQLDDILEADLDCVFIGRSDLTVSMGETDRNAPAVVEACEEVARKAREAGKTVGTFTTDLNELPRWRELGVSLFLLGSELGMMKAGARDFSAKVRAKL